MSRKQIAAVAFVGVAWFVALSVLDAARNETWQKGTS